MNIALIGFGGVGKSFIKLLKTKKDLTSELKLKYIIKSSGGIYNKEGLNIEEINEYIDNNINLEKHSLWREISIKNIIENNDIDCLIELTNTNIESGEPGYGHIKKALSNSINVVTGNKGPILLHYNELKKISKDNNVNLKVGCTTGGALPSISVGSDGIKGADILKIEGVLNGTTNYIIEEMYKSKLTYEEALYKAQSLKIAELNPRLDVSGYDTCIKMIIIGQVLLNREIKLENCEVKGIESITLKEIESCYKEGKKIKLIGELYKNENGIKVTVKPKKIDDSHPLYFVDGKNKGVYYNTDILGNITVVGGASSPLNAAAAILRDLLSFD